MPTTDPTPDLILETISNESYVPSNWKAGDTVTSAKLNKIENGIVNSGSAFIVNMLEDRTLDRTWKEIYDGNYYFIVVKEKAADDSPSTKTIWTISEVTVGKAYSIEAYGYISGELRNITFIAPTMNDYPSLG